VFWKSALSEATAPAPALHLSISSYQPTSTMKTLAGAALCLASGADAGELILKGKALQQRVEAARTHPARRYLANMLHHEASGLHRPPQTVDGARCNVTAELVLILHSRTLGFSRAICTSCSMLGVSKMPNPEKALLSPRAYRLNHSASC
jgi:hypothetical protein